MARDSYKQELKDAVAKRLKAVMSEFQLAGQKPMAEMCGVTVSAANNWLQAYNLPRVPEMTLLSERTGITLDWIYRGHVGSIDSKLAMRLSKKMQNIS